MKDKSYKIKVEDIVLDATEEERLLEVLGLFGYFDENGKWIEREQ